MAGKKDGQTERGYRGAEIARGRIDDAILVRLDLMLDRDRRAWLISFGDSGFVVLYRFDDDLAAVMVVQHQRAPGS